MALTGWDTVIAIAQAQDDPEVRAHATNCAGTTPWSAQREGSPARKSRRDPAAPGPPSQARVSPLGDGFELDAATTARCRRPAHNLSCSSEATTLVNAVPTLMITG